MEHYYQCWGSSHSFVKPPVPVLTVILKNLEGSHYKKEKKRFR